MCIYEYISSYMLMRTMLRSNYKPTLNLIKPDSSSLVLRSTQQKDKINDNMLRLNASRMFIYGEKNICHTSFHTMLQATSVITLKRIKFRQTSLLSKPVHSVYFILIISLKRWTRSDSGESIESPSFSRCLSPWQMCEAKECRCPSASLFICGVTKKD